MIKKVLFGFLVVLCFLPFVPSVAYAALVDVKTDGRVVLNVLGTEDSLALAIPKKESLQIKDIASIDTTNNNLVSLAQANGKVNLNVVTSDGEKNLDVTNYKDSLVKIEERSPAQQIQIGLLAGKFTIQENGVIALTDFPIKVDPKGARITVSAPSGDRYLAILPFEAYQNLVKSRIMSTLGENKLTISEADGGELSYTVPGQKILNVFNLFAYPVDVTAKVSASTGEVLSIDEPIWLKVFSFAFI